VGCVRVSNSLGYVSAKNWQNWIKSDKDVTNIKGDVFFLRHRLCSHKKLWIIFNVTTIT